MYIKTFILLWMSCVACVAQGTYSVTGKDTQSVARVYLQEVGDSVRIDSAGVVDGSFTFSGEISTPKFVEILSDDGNLMGQFILEPGSIVLYGNNFYGKGAPMNDAFTGLVNELQTYDAKVSDGQMTREQCDSVYAQKVVALVEAHLDDALGARSFHYFKYWVEKFTFKRLYDNGGPSIRKVPELIKDRAFYELTAKTEEGMMFTDFAAEYDGAVHRLSDYVGKGQYVLVDFWASWCGPCKAEIPNIIEAYNRYKDRGFVVVGIPVSDKPEDTQQAMEQLGITYPQIRDEGGVASTPYGVTFIPQIILFGPDGMIVRRGLRGADIMKAVSECME